MSLMGNRGARANGAVPGAPGRNIQEDPDAGASWTRAAPGPKKEEGNYERSSRSARPCRPRNRRDNRLDSGPPRLPGDAPRGVSRDEATRRRGGRRVPRRSRLVRGRAGAAPPRGLLTLARKGRVRAGMPRRDRARWGVLPRAQHRGGLVSRPVLRLLREAHSGGDVDRAPPGAARAGRHDGFMEGRETREPAGRLFDAKAGVLGLPRRAERRARAPGPRDRTPEERA